MTMFEPFQYGTLMVIPYMVRYTNLKEVQMMVHLFLCRHLLYPFEKLRELLFHLFLSIVLLFLT